LSTSPGDQPVRDRPFRTTSSVPSSSLPTVTGAIIARDAAGHLASCLDSLAWTDAQLVLLDSRTRDGSAAIARERAATVVVREFTTFPAQRNAAIELVQSNRPTDWLLFVDADERATPALAAEVRAVIGYSVPVGPVGYWIPRRNFIWGGWIRHGGWSPDHQLRLLKVGTARYDRDVHEVVVLKGNAGYLREPLLHYNYDSLSQFTSKQRQYALLDARRLAREGQKTKPQNFVLQPVRELRRRLLELEGWRDGWRGIVLAILLAWYTGMTYCELARFGGLAIARSPRR
jgi:glycosyltransferase involved in cell wall biosynthesis